MSSYQTYAGDELGAFLPGLMKVVKAPFKATASIAKGFAHNPWEGIKATVKAPFRVLGAVKYAAVGSSKPKPAAAQTPKNGTAWRGVTGSSFVAPSPMVDMTTTMPPLVTSFMPQPAPSPSYSEPLVTAPGSEIPQGAAPQSKFPTGLVIGLAVAVGGGFLLTKAFKKKG